MDQTSAHVPFELKLGPFICHGHSAFAYISHIFLFWLPWFDVQSKPLTGRQILQVKFQEDITLWPPQSGVKHHFYKATGWRHQPAQNLKPWCSYKGPQAFHQWLAQSEMSILRAIISPLQRPIPYHIGVSTDGGLVVLHTHTTAGGCGLVERTKEDDK